MTHTTPAAWPESCSHSLMQGAFHVRNVEAPKGAHARPDAAD